MADFRLEVEEVFSIRGRGTVVTGEIVSGEIGVGQQVVLLEGVREVARTTVTGIQVTGRRDAERAGVGEQVGLLLRGVRREDVLRAAVVVRADEHDRTEPPDPALPPLGAVDASVPLLLLPIRLETRFVGDVLRVRAWPDDIHVHTLEERVTATESALVEQLAATAVDARPAAFEALAARVGEPRARLLFAHAESGDAPGVVDSLWNARPTARLLPERLVAVAELPDGRRVAARGAEIDAEGLAVAPGPGDETAVDPGGPMAWMADFAEARAEGMGLELPLPAGTRAVARLTVFGVSGHHGADDVAALLRGHAFTTGLSTHAPLAPTKGTGAGPYAGLRGDAPHAALADALGLRAQDVPLAEVPVDSGDVQRAARRVVWEAAVRPAVVAGFGLSAALVPDSADEDALDRIGRRYLTLLDAYGPLPTLTVGPQPYGVLPVTATASLVRDGIDASIAAQATVVGALRGAAVEARAAERAEGGRLAMLQALGRQPDGRSWRGRPVLPGHVVADLFARSGDSPAPSIRDAAGGLRDTLEHVQDALAAFGLPTDGAMGDAAFSARAFRICEPLVAPGAEDPHGDPPDELEPNYLRALLRRPIGEQVDAASSRPLLDLLAEAAVLGVLGDVASQQTAGPDATVPGLGERLVETDPSPRRQAVVDAFGDRPIGTLLEELPRVVQVSRGPDIVALSEALHVLEAAPPAATHAALAAAIDLASARVDAWITSFATEELQRLREARPTGLTVGAWGVVEDLVTVDGPGEQPMVLAPSIDHAATAALLHQARAASAEGVEELLTVDISAPAVRGGRRLARQLRRGTDVAEALGRLAADELRDRWRADADAADAPAAIAAVAAAYPLREGGVVADEGSAGAAGAAARVGRIDGLALLDGGGDPAVADLPAALAQLPAALGEVRTELEGAVAGLRDLLLAEGAHTLALGRPEAAAAALGGLVAGEPPPGRFSVLDPQRRGESLALKVGLVVAAGQDPVDGSVLHQAIPGVAALVAQLVGPMTGDLVVSGRQHVDGQDPTDERATVGVEQLGLSALELSLLARPGRDPIAELAGRAAAFVEDELGHGLVDVVVEASDELAHLLWAAGRAGELLASSRPLAPADVSDPTPGGDPPPARHDVEAEQRTTSALLSIRDDLATSSTEDAPADLRAALDALRPLGIAAAGYRIEERADAPALAARAAAAAAALDERLTAAGSITEGARLPALLPDAPVPGICTTDPDAWDGALGLRGAGPRELGAFVEQSQAVRARVGALADLLLAGADDRVPLRPVQWPVRHATSAAPVDWIGGPMREDDVHTGHTSLLACGLPRDRTPSATVVGLLVDEWEEVVPQRRATLGVAARAPAPPARPPQVALLAVPPVVGQDWTTEALAELIGDVVDVASARTVDLRELPDADPADGARSRFDGLGWLLPLAWVEDHEVDLRAAACPPDAARQEVQP